MSATRFVGDGSGLTNLVGATADRVVSGTTSLVAVSSTGFVSLTQAGVNTGWFDPARGLYTLGVSATGNIYAPTAHFTNNLAVGGSTANGFLISNTSVFEPSLMGTTMGGIQVQGPRNSNLVFDLRNNEDTDAIAFRYSAANNGIVSNIALIIRNGGKVGIGDIITPTTPLEVSGTVSATAVNATTVKLADTSNLPCTPERYGTIRYSNGKQYMCMPR